MERGLLPLAEISGQVPPGDPATGHGGVPGRHDEAVAGGEVHGGGDHLQEAQVGARAPHGAGGVGQDGQGTELGKMRVSKTKNHVPLALAQSVHIGW